MRSIFVSGVWLGQRHRGWLLVIRHVWHLMRRLVPPISQSYCLTWVLLFEANWRDSMANLFHGLTILLYTISFKSSDQSVLRAFLTPPLPDYSLLTGWTLSRLVWRHYYALIAWIIALHAFVFKHDYKVKSLMYNRIVSMVASKLQLSLSFVVVEYSFKALVGFLVPACWEWPT